MKKITVHISKPQYEWLRQQSEQLGVTAAEILRQALEERMQSKSIRDEKLFKALNLGQGGSIRGTQKGAIEELRQVVALLTHAMRQVAPPEVMQEFDTRLAEWRNRKPLGFGEEVSPGQE